MERSDIRGSMTWLSRMSLPLHPGYKSTQVAPLPCRAYGVVTLVMNDSLPPKLAAGEAEHDADEFKSLPGWLYHDPEFFAYEAERVFRPSWQIVCHVNDIPNTGDYVTFDFSASRSSRYAATMAQSARSIMSAVIARRVSSTASRSLPLSAHLPLPRLEL